MKTNSEQAALDLNVSMVSVSARVRGDLKP